MLLNILECKVQSPQPRISQSKVSAVPMINPAQGTASPTQCVDRWGFPGGPVVKNPLPMQAARQEFDPWGREEPPEESNPLQYCCLENPMDRGAWRATVQGITKNGT